jgi:hypothetical protein
MRRRIDSELVARTNDFMRRQVENGRPFFAYVPLTQLHYPVLPHRDFAGKTGVGNFADSMVEMDFRVGQVLDQIQSLGSAKDTVVRVSPALARDRGDLARDLSHLHGRLAARAVHGALAGAGRAGARHE